MKYTILLSILSQEKRSLTPMYCLGQGCWNLVELWSSNTDVVLSKDLSSQ